MSPLPRQRKIILEYWNPSEEMISDLLFGRPYVDTIWVCVESLPKLKSLQLLFPFYKSPLLTSQYPSRHCVGNPLGSFSSGRGTIHILSVHLLRFKVLDGCHPSLNKTPVTAYMWLVCATVMYVHTWVKKKMLNKNQNDYLLGRLLDWERTGNETDTFVSLFVCH